MTQVVIQGNTYSDDGSAAKDMLNGGHRLHFFPLVQDIVTTAADVAADAVAAAVDAASALNVATAMKGTSTTSIAIGTGSKTLTTQASKQFSVGNFVTIARTSEPAKLMHGVVTAYNSGTGSITVDVTTIAGAGTYTDWTIAVSGATGNTGLSGDGSVTYMSLVSGATLTTSDKAKIIDCNGTFTLAFQAAASLGSTWTTTIRNIGTGVITLDPNGAETIEGAATFAVAAGQQVRVSSNGTNLVVISYTPNVLVSLPILQNNSPYTAKSNDEVISINIPTIVGSDDISYIYKTTSGLIAFPTATTTGTCYTSTDGVTWVARSTGSTAGVSAATIAVTGDKILIYQSTTVGFVSTDGGVTWSAAQTLPITTPDILTAVNGTFICIEGYTNYYTSTTGLTGSWTTRAYQFPNPSSISQQSDMAYLGTTLLINVAGHNVSYTSTDNGNTWTSTSNTTGDTGLCAAGAGVFVGWNASNFISSTNGTSWTTRTANASNVNKIEFLNSLFVSVGTSNIWTSSDGITWTQRSSAVDTHNDVAYGGGVYIAVGNTGSVYTSSDAITWTAQADVGTSSFVNIKHNGSIFVGVKSNGQILTTTDGVTWTDRGTLPVASVTLRNCLTVNGGTFVLVGSDVIEYSLYTSTDGITWTLLSTSPFGTTASQIRYLNSTYHALDISGYFKSTDLVTWTSSLHANITNGSIPRSNNTTILMSHNVGASLKYWTSTDGITWTLRLLPENSNNVPYAIGVIRVNHEGEFTFMSSDYSKYYYSSDGITWSSLTMSGISPIVVPIKVNGMYVGRTSTELQTANVLTGPWTNRRSVTGTNNTYLPYGFVKLSNNYYVTNGVNDFSLDKLDLTATGLFSS